MQIVVTGNCQVAPLGSALAALIPGSEVRPVHLGVSTVTGLEQSIAQANLWVRMAVPGDDELPKPQPSTIVVKVPTLDFAAFHPDAVYALTESGGLFRGLTDYHSAIALWAWKRGLEPQDLAILMNPDVMARLNYDNYWTPSVAALAGSFEQSSIPFEPFWRAAKRQGVFMHTVNHPKLSLVSLLATAVLEASGILERTSDHGTGDIADVLDDALDHLVWPVYPFVALSLGVPGSWRWRVNDSVYDGLIPWAHATWNSYGDAKPSEVVCPRIDDGVYDAVLSPLLDARAER